MAQRKLQTEVDRTLKKVAEGVELFENMYDKLQQSTNQTQKEKLEVDLKTQIKKLQRLRDSIKGWIASSDIKDKTDLMANRKLIETQMEKFKACEKEMKTKAFSKEGLIAAARLDPKEQAKNDCAAWITNFVDELGRQIEASEAEVEQIQGSAGKRSKKSGAVAERVSELEHLNDRRRWHSSRLELILRLLENGQLSPDRIGGIKDDIAYFAESNTEEDFEEDEGIYDELNLDEEEDAYGMGDQDIQSSHDSVSVAEPEPLPPTPVKAPPTKPSRTASQDDDHPTPSKKTPSRKSTAEPKPEPPKPIPAPNFSQQPMSSALKAGLTSPPIANAVPTGPRPTTTAAPMPTIRYATAAAAAVSQPSAQAPAAVAPPTPTMSSASAQPSSGASEMSSPVPASAVPPSPSPPESIAKPSPPPGISVPQPLPAQALPSPTAPGLSPVSQTATQGPPPGVPQTNGQYQPDGLHPPSATDSASLPYPGLSSASVPPTTPSLSNAAPSAASAQASPARPQISSGLPSVLADLAASFESAKQKSVSNGTNVGRLHQVLESSFMNVPEPSDADKPKYYVPKNPYPAPPYYPQAPRKELENPAVFGKMDTDTLFFCFYFLQGTYAQYLAARELKKQSWRFHKLYLTWFQRHAEPTTITDEYEEGAYIYFDWEGSWCERKKSHFRFDYVHLEDSLQ